MLEDGLGFLADQLEEHASRTVTYRRGAQAVELAATLGSSLLRVTERGGATRVVRTDRDFLIRAALLEDAGLARPRDGDLVDVAFGGVTRRYEVMPVGDEPAWRYSDPHQTIVRVHAKSLGKV